MKRLALLAVVALTVSVFILTGCRERIIYTGPADWLLLSTDANDGSVAYNGHYLYVDADFSDNVLLFKVETWAPVPNPASNVQFAVFFDTDASAATGLSATTPGTWEAPNDIGADYMMFVGTDTTSTGTQNSNLIYRWNSAVTPRIWEEVGPVATPYQPANTDSVMGSVSLADIGNPAGAINVMSILLCNPGTSEYRDHIPNTGHAIIDLAADSVIPAASPVAVLHMQQQERKGHVSLITGKVDDFKEAR